MLYEGYDIEDQEGVCMFLPADAASKEQLTQGAKCVFEVEADSWEEAMQAWHEFKGWVPYVPF